MYVSVWKIFKQCNKKAGKVFERLLSIIFIIKLFLLLKYFIKQFINKTGLEIDYTIIRVLILTQLYQTWSRRFS